MQKEAKMTDRAEDIALFRYGLVREAGRPEAVQG